MSMALNWPATSARDPLTTNIVFADRKVQRVPLGSRCAIYWSISGWPLLAAADTAGAEIADQFPRRHGLGTMIIVGAGA